MTIPEIENGVQTTKLSDFCTEIITKGIGSLVA